MDTQTPVLMKGALYFYEKEDQPEPFDLGELLDNVAEGVTPSYYLDRGAIHPHNEGIERITFESHPTDGTKNWHFTGFLYQDGTILGKAKYVRGSNLDDEPFKGHFEKNAKSKGILIWGISVIENVDWPTLIILSSSLDMIEDWNKQVNKL